MSPKRAVSTGLVVLSAVSFTAPHLEHAPSGGPGAISVTVVSTARDHDDPHTHSPEHSTDSTFGQMSANVAPGGSGSTATIVAGSHLAAFATVTRSRA